MQVLLHSYTISLNELEQIIIHCQQKRMRAQKCLSIDELCASFIDPIHNPGKGTCYPGLSRSNSPAYHPQGIPYRPPSTTTTPSALEMGMQPSPLFRPLAAPAPIGSSLTTTSTFLFRPVATAPAATAPALAPAAQPADLYPELPDYDPDHPDNRGGSNKKTKKIRNKAKKRTKLTKRKGKHNKMEGNGGLLASRSFPIILRRNAKHCRKSITKNNKRRRVSHNKVTKKHRRNAVKRSR